ncbi:MAG: hypothetical protein VYB54_14775 [Pseudomonadota bacterium]|nr:hypothetical protein [Pseudomonadota bacterium]
MPELREPVSDPCNDGRKTIWRSPSIREMVIRLETGSGSAGTADGGTQVTGP